MLKGFLAIQLFIIGLNTLPVFGQTWAVTDPRDIEQTGQRDIVPVQYITYRVDSEAVRSVLFNAPAENSTSLSNSTTLLTVGLPDGTMDVFKIVEYDMMESGLSARYPEIRTYRGISVSNPYRRMRADWTASGFRAVIRGPEGMSYIDHFQRNDIVHRISYFRKDFQRKDEWSCATEDADTGLHDNGQSRMQGDCMFRTYRLAQAANGEYSNYHGAFSIAQSGLVMSAVVTVVNRVNEVYEADMAIRMILVDNTDDLFFYDPATDGYTNSNGGAMLGENITKCNSIIGSANYDIGHVFSTGGGGVAYLACVCGSSKAGGVTGGSNPVGDPFSIDYVAHEMGHQFGGSHTFNGTAGSCNGNRSASSAYEPGSGSTIMAYAGICGSQDLQPNSDAYMHARSILQIANHVVGGSSCESFITMNNTAPVAAAIADYNIPKSTPFVLTASVTDAENDPLLYCWEQYDLESSSTEPPTSDDTNGPMYRSFDYVSSPSRYFPRLSNLVSNTSYAWEVLSSVERTLVFRMTVKDYHNIGGCTDEDDVSVFVKGAAGPFLVTSQSSATTWVEGTTQTITWNVSNTTAAPISCANVDIKLSYDGGYTYPVTILSNEPNDGSATITVPDGLTTLGRVMVKASNNIFFDINNANITIDPCLTVVTLTSGTGSGSLPAAINCASAGDIILLSAGLNGQTINVGGSPLIINKNLTIQSLASDIKITGSGLRVFEIANGTTFELNSMTLVAGTSLTGGVLINQGNLTLNNVKINKNVAVSGATLIQNTSGQLKLVGNCSML